MDTPSSHLQAFYDLADIILVSLDRDGKIEEINPNGGKMLGWEPEQLIGKDWFEVCVPLNLGGFIKTLFQKLIAGELEPYEHFQGPVRCRDGSERIIAWHNTIIRDGSGKITGTASTGTDITRWLRVEVNGKVTQHALDISEAQYKAIVDSAAEAIVTWDGNGRIASFNTAAENYFGYRRGEVVGQNVKMLIPMPFHEYDGYPRNYRYGADAREVVAIRKDGSTFPVDLCITDVALDNGRWFSALIRDLSERKEAEATSRARDMEAKQLKDELLHVDRVHIVNEMASGIAHEVNQPLTAIINYTSACQRMVEQDEINREGLRRALDHVARQAKRASDIIRMLRNMMKKHRTRYEPVNLLELVKSTLDICKTDFDNHGITIKAQLQSQPLVVEADAIQIQQVLLNLIKNSVDALCDAESADKSVDVSLAARNRDTARIVVKDNGPGITRDCRDRVFESFFTTKNKGLGLGLGICRSIIIAHGGIIDSNSQCDNGAEFYVDLPLLNPINSSNAGQPHEAIL